MASALQILHNTFGVNAITPTDPGIVRLAAIRTGVYPEFGQVTITPQSEVNQILGIEPDKLALAEISAPGIGGKLGQAALKTAFGVISAGVGFSTLFEQAGRGLTANTSPTKPRSTGMAYYDPTSGGWTDTPTSPAPTGSGSFGVSDIFGGASASDWLGLLNTGLQTFNNYQTDLSTSRAIVSGGRVAVGGMAVGRAVGSALFRRFPNLAAGLNALKMAGKNYATRSRLYSLLKRFGPDVLITGGILSAAAVSELMIAGPGRRRMNPANVKALRRAHRRMASFHHICRKNDALMHRGARRKPAGFARGTTITQVK